MHNLPFYNLNEESFPKQNEVWQAVDSRRMHILMYMSTFINLYVFVKKKNHTYFSSLFFFSSHSSSL